MKHLSIVRAFTQYLALALFILTLYFTMAGTVDLYPMNFFLRIDPLAALSTILSSGGFESILIWSFAVVLLTLVFGRFFCGFICPMGTLSHLAEKIAALRKKMSELPDKWEYRELYSVKYYIFLSLCVLALIGSNQFGLLDPISLSTRSFAKAVFPAVNFAFFGESALKVTYHAFAIFLIFALLITFAARLPRFFCRVLCPLGALFGFLNAASLFRISRDKTKCGDCNICGMTCSGAANPHSDFRVSECLLCFRCLRACGKNALSYSFMPESGGLKTAPSLTKRKFVFSLALPALLYPVLRSGKDSPEPASGRSFNPYVIRPPKSLEEEKFVEICVKCGECMKVCPTQVLQPALLESGLEGMFSPVADFSLGYCQHTCTACGDVCPTGAIQKFASRERLGDVAKGIEPFRMGTAFFDYGRCLPYAFGIVCTKCEELCPTAPKAIISDKVERTADDGTKYILPLPKVVPKPCIGCGICEYACPVVGKGIRVTAANESRSENKKMIL